jgi:hypothetical protein
MGNMAGMNRASYNRPHVHIGKPRSSARIATDREASQIRNIVKELNEALGASTEPTFEYKLSQAYRNLYHMLKERRSA